jgi:outer membrane protein assembly factor BamC
VPASLTVAGLAALLAACTTSTDGLFSEKVDYRSAPTNTQTLEIPPDLTQLARESRYQVQTTGVVSAAAVAAAPSAVRPAPGGPAASPGTVAPAEIGAIRIERQGQQRWLVVPQTPEQVWPQLRAFWEGNGFTLVLDNPQTGVMETNWSEDRAKLPKDAVRNVLGSVLKNLYDTGERDMFRTRVEGTEGGSEIFVSHRGAQEVYNEVTKDTTTWTARPNDPGLEAEFLARMMVALSGRGDARGMPAGAGGAAAAKGPAAASQTPVASAAALVASAPELPARARAVQTPGGAMLEVDDPFDRAWRRVGLALDRGSFTVEDRDRAQGLYYVRYVDPRTAGQDEGNFLTRLFSRGPDPQTPVRYRIALEGSGNRTTVRVLTSAGAPEPGENGKRIVAQLVNELK